MKKIRLIAKLDVKDEYIVKGIQLEGLRKLGSPNEFAIQYYQDGIDEIIYIDSVASLYNRNNLQHIVKNTTESVFIPITVGGGLRKIEDVRNALVMGADKVAINTGAIKNSNLIKQVATVFGSQCMVLSVQAKKVGLNKWEAYYDNGREKSGLDVLEWVQKGEALGAGEIFLVSVDKEGMQRGMDIDLIKAVSDKVSITVIACGGVGSAEDIINAAFAGASAVAVASIIHYGKETVQSLKHQISLKGVKVRL